jgi:iron complex outermembrane receptor protein
MTQSFRSPRRALAGLTCFLMLESLPPTLQAADTSEDRRTNGLEEIIVTARRREENAQQVPIAITVVSAAALQANNISTVQDVQQLVPSMTVTTGNVGQRDSANVAIRGQGYGSIAGQPAVAMYLNEVPIPADHDGQIAGGPGLFFDMENVQVLKGPQGTLFGRNTMGGAVLLQTARPTNEFGGQLQAGYGNYNDRELNGEINLPIIDDKLLARIAVSGQIRDGFSHVQSMPGYPNGIDLDNRDTRSVRTSLTYRPTDSFQNDAILTYQEYTSHGSADFLTAIDPKGWSNPCTQRCFNCWRNSKHWERVIISPLATTKTVPVVTCLRWKTSRNSTSTIS